MQEADVFIPAAIPNVIDAAVAQRLRVKLVAEGANNAVVPHVEDVLHRLGILYLPGQALNWGGVKSSTLEALFRESTKCRLPFAEVEERVRAALAPLSTDVDLGWTLDWLRSGLPGPPLDRDETRAFAIAILEDLARSNTRWLMRELVASGHQRTPLELVRSLARGVRALKVQLLSLIEQGLGAEFFAPDTSLPRLMTLLDERLKELLFDAGSGTLTDIQVAEQRQMLQQMQTDIPNGLSPVFASLLAALDLARKRSWTAASYSRATLDLDLAILRRPDAPPLELETSLYRLQRVHPGLHRVAFVQALAGLSSRTIAVAGRAPQCRPGPGQARQRRPESSDHPARWPGRSGVCRSAPPAAGRCTRWPSPRRMAGEGGDHRAKWGRASNRYSAPLFD